VFRLFYSYTMWTNKFSNIFNKDTVSIDGDILYTRLYTTLYPKITFVEDARPDYFVKRNEFETILKEVYGTTGRSLYKTYSSGKCLEVRLIDKYKTMFVITLLMERDLIDCAYRLSSKDLEIVIELGDMEYLQTKLDKMTTKAYNSLELPPLVLDKELVQVFMPTLFYPTTETERGVSFCSKYDMLKFDRIKSRDTITSKTKIGFAIP